jgi:hypothetical protein
MARSDDETLRLYLSRALVEAEYWGLVEFHSPDGEVHPVDNAQIIQIIKAAAAEAHVALDRALAVGEWAPRC